MKIKMLMFLLINFIFAASAQAKIHYKGIEVNDSHATTIKGFLYEISHSAINLSMAQQWRPLFAKTLVWLDDKQNSAETHYLESCDDEEAKIIADTIEVLTRVFNGDFGISPEYAASHWNGIGQRVVAAYSQQTAANSSNTRVVWKLELKPEERKAQTRDLLYRAY
jgi:hypothetical protein